MITFGGMTLRRFHDKDREILVQLADSPNVSKYLAPRFPSPYRLDDANNWVATTQGEKQTHNFAIEWQGQLVGGVGAEPYSGLFARTAELGYWLGECYWGQGLAARAVKLFMPYAFNELSFIRLQAVVFVENHNSIKVLEKCNFSREGVLHNHISKNGYVTDAVLYAKLASE